MNLIDHPCWNCGKPGSHVYGGKYACTACDVGWTEGYYWDEHNDVWHTYRQYRRHKAEQSRACKRTWHIDGFINFSKPGAPSCP